MSKIDIPTTIAGLSPSAKALLLGYLIVGVREPIEKMMGICGIGKRITAYDARKELEAAGWIVMERRPGKPPLVTLQCIPSLQSANTINLLPTNHEVLTSSDLSNRLINRYIDSVGLCENGVNIENGGNGSTGGSSSGVVLSGDASEGYYQEQLVPLKVATLRVPTTPKVATLTVPSTLKVATPTGTTQMGDTSDGYYPSRLLDRCLEVDAMDGSGTPQSSTFQAKRRAGIPLVGELWEKFIPGVSLTDADKKRLLGWCDNSLETLHDELEYVAGLIASKGKVEYPRGYALKTIEARSKNRASSLQSAIVKPTALVGAAAYREGEPLPEPEPVWLEESLREGEKIMKKLLAEKGWLE